MPGEEERKPEEQGELVASHPESQRERGAVDRMRRLRPVPGPKSFCSEVNFELPEEFLKSSGARGRPGPKADRGGSAIKAGGAAAMGAATEEELFESSTSWSANRTVRKKGWSHDLQRHIAPAHMVQSPPRRSGMARASSAQMLLPERSTASSGGRGGHHAERSRGNEEGPSATGATGRCGSSDANSALRRTASWAGGNRGPPGGSSYGPYQNEDDEPDGSEVLLTPEEQMQKLKALLQSGERRLREARVAGLRAYAAPRESLIIAPGAHKVLGVGSRCHR